MLDFTNNTSYLTSDHLEEELEKVNFPVAIEQIPTVPQELGQVLRRTDTGDALGLVKSRYNPINHYSAFNGAIEAIKSANESVSFDNVAFNINQYENGAMAKMEIIFPDHHVKVGEHDLYLKYIARNSYNGKWKFQSFFGWLNQVCFNTLVSGQKLAYSANRHTANFDIDSANHKIKNAVQAITDETQDFQKWWNRRVTDQAVVDLFKKTLCKMKLSDAKNIAGASDTNKKRLETLMVLYDEEVKQIHGRGDYGRQGAMGSLWCIYQASTAWSTHISDYSDKNHKKHIVQYQRQNEVTKMLQSPHWQKIDYLETI